MTALSARLIWTKGYGIDHGSPVVSYDVEGETTFEPGVWHMIAAGNGGQSFSFASIGLN